MEQFNAVYLVVKSTCYTPVHCNRCRDEVELVVEEEFSYASITAMHCAAKAVLQTLPQPIFEEVWNHIGWEPLIE